MRQFYKTFCKIDGVRDTPKCLLQLTRSIPSKRGAVALCSTGDSVEIQLTEEMALWTEVPTSEKITHIG